MTPGTYSDTDIKKALALGIVGSNREISEEQIQPSSLDLTMSNKLWCLPYSSIPRLNMELFLEENSQYAVELRDGTFLHKNVVYIVELNEYLNLPDGVEAKSNPKSSTGRIDIHVRLLTNNGLYFDQVPAGYKGKLYLEIYSQTFDIIASPGISLNQIRIFDLGTKTLDDGMLRYLSRSEKLVINEGEGKVDDEVIEHDSVYLTLDLSGEESALIARHDAPPIDLRRRDLELKSFFEKPNFTKEGLIISPNSFYILSSKEIISIPIDHCGEMADISTKSGEFRAHYAGFFDPGFCAKAVLEVRNTGAPFLITNGQRIANIKFSKLKSPPIKTYGEGIGSNYQGQKINPGKFFKKETTSEIKN